MKKKRFIYFIILLALLILCIKYSDSILGFAGFLWSLVTPLILGCVIAYILNILVTRIESLPCFSREGSLSASLETTREPISTKLCSSRREAILLWAAVSVIAIFFPPF